MEKKIPTVRIEFISDYICPWCYLGKSRLEKVKKDLIKEINLEIEVVPYLLYPTLPKGGVDKSVFSKRTKPGMGRSLRHEAEKEGVHINYKKIHRIPNSLEAHRLTWLVAQNDKYKLAKKIFEAYFEGGHNIEDKNLLINIAQQTEVQPDIIEQFSKTDQGLKEIMLSIEKTRESFISVVPSLRLNGQFLIPGLQTKEIWEKYIRRAAKIQED